MKKLLLLISLSILCIWLTSCSKDGSGGSSGDNGNVKEIRKNVETIVEFAAMKDCITFDLLKSSSDGYKTELFKSNKISYKEVDVYYSSLEKLLQNKEAVMQAAQALDAAVSAQKSGNLRANSGIGDAFGNFFKWVTGSGKNSRNRILTVASNLDEADRTKLFNSLRPEWKEKSQNEKEFWDKLQKGDYDYQASQMYNDFYYNTATKFVDLAIDKGLTVQQIVVREGAEGVTVGAKLIVEVAKTATPLGKGMEMVEKAEEFKENVVKIYTDPSGLIKDKVKDAIKEKITGFVDVDGLVNAEKISEEAGEAIKTLTEFTIAATAAEEAIENSFDKGLGKILDSDKKGEKTDIVIAVNSNPGAKNPQVVIGVQPDKPENKDEVDVVLPKGDWTITVVDKKGNSDKVETEIEAGVTTIVVVSTDPDDTHEVGEYSLSVWASPADPEPGQQVVVYARISPKVAGEEIYFNIEGTDGYSKTETKETDSNGEAYFTIPGGGLDVHDVVTIKIVKTGLTRTISYNF